MPKAERLALLVEENAWKNGLVMWMFPQEARDAMPQFVQTWVRCMLLCAAVYFLVGGLWCYYAYWCFGDKLFRPGTIPGAGDVLEQIKVCAVRGSISVVWPSGTMTCWIQCICASCCCDSATQAGMAPWVNVSRENCAAQFLYVCARKRRGRTTVWAHNLACWHWTPHRASLHWQVSVLAIPLYSLLPTLTEWMAEKGWTLVYPRVDNVGLPMYVAYFALYITSVEFGVYWMHRGLHEIKWAYK